MRLDGIGNYIAKKIDEIIEQQSVSTSKSDTRTEEVASGRIFLSCDVL